MKKSTILLLVVVYVIAFFLVGLLGMQLRSHYSVSYLNEIKVVPWEETNLTLVTSNEEKFGDETDEKHVRIVHDDTYKVKYVDGLVLKFNVVLVPANTSIDDYKLSFEESTAYNIVKNDVDKTIFVDEIKKVGRFGVNIQFTVEDNHMNGVKSTVTVIVY